MINNDSICAKEYLKNTAIPKLVKYAEIQIQCYGTLNMAATKLGERKLSKPNYRAFEEYDIFLKNSQWMLDKKTLKFEIDSVKEKNAVMLVFIGHPANEVKNIMQMIIGVNDKCLTPCEWRKSDKKLKEYCNDYLNKIIEQIG